MARKRASKKRVDYRKGGRVSVRTGGRQFTELDAVMSNKRQFGDTSTKKGQTLPQTIVENIAVKQPTPANYIAEGDPTQTRRQIDQSKFATPSAEESARLDALNKLQQERSGLLGSATNKVRQDLVNQIRADEQVGGVESGAATPQAQTATPARLREQSSSVFGAGQNRTNRTQVGNRSVETGNRTTGGGRQGMASNNLGVNVELTEDAQKAVDEANEAAAEAQAKAKAADAADPTKDDPAKKLMGRVGTEEFPTYTPTAPAVSKLNTGAITEQSSDADKLAAGISTNVQQLSDTDKPQVADPTAVTADRPFASEGTAGSAATPADYDAATYEADLIAGQPATKAAQGEVSKTAEAEGPKFTDANKVQTATRDAQAEKEALAQTADYKIDPESLVKKVEGETAQVVQTDPAEKQQRELQLGMPAPDGDAAIIINEFGFGNSMKPRLVQGAKAKQAAAAKLATDHDLDPEVANQIMEDVEGFKIEGQSQESLGAVAALPKEALVSTQMENLVAGMEEGKPPSWARPAVAAVEQMMAQRGLSASSVGRDALFNAIIQSAMPIAQSNATALQQRAAQNLSNEQQALIQDREIAARFLEKNAEFRQQMEIANLSNDQQMRLANLTSRNQNESENLSARQQTEMANLNARLQTNLTAAKIAESMGVAQLNVDQQRAVQNAAMVANVDMNKFNAAQQIELTNSKFMQTMTMADLDNRQQAVLQNATLQAQMDMTNASERTKASVANAQNYLQMNLTNVNNRQQATITDQQLKQQRLLSDQAAENTARQFNAKSENQNNQFMVNMANQMEQFNKAQINAMEQFNVGEENRMAATEADQKLRADSFNAEQVNRIRQFDAELDFRADSWNAQNAQAIQQSNIEWRRKCNTIDTAAQNAVNATNAQMQFGMTQQAQSALWQQLRDAAHFSHQDSQSEWDRRMNIANSAMGNETLMTHRDFKTEQDLIWNLITKIMGPGESIGAPIRED